MMPKIVSSLFIVAAAFSAANAFSPATVPQTSRGDVDVKIERPAPYFVTVLEAKEEVKEPKLTPRAQKQPAAKKTTAHNDDGIMAPVVKFAKSVFGDEQLNMIRGKAIGLHSKVIGEFVDTYETQFGDKVLEILFNFADKNNNGKIEQDELSAALRALGFDLKDKQVEGIFSRADIDANGGLDIDEWKKEAPKTLRTNLIKLAKKNGGELGFLV